MRLSALSAICAALALAVAPVQAQEDGGRRSGLARGGLVGQVVAVLPLTYLSRDTSLTDAILLRDRVEVLRWADSVLGEALLDLVPEVTWTLPPELRRIARRNAGVVQEPDRMGHAVLRSSRLATVPDPTRAQLRTLVAFVGGRLALVPAALTLSRTPEGHVQAVLDVVVADARTGQVGYRGRPTGVGASPAEALVAAMQALFPPQDSPGP